MGTLLNREHKNVSPHLVWPNCARALASSPAENLIKKKGKVFLSFFLNSCLSQEAAGHLRAAATLRERLAGRGRSIGSCFCCLRLISKGGRGGVEGPPATDI